MFQFQPLKIVDEWSQRHDTTRHDVTIRPGCGGVLLERSSGADGSVVGELSPLRHEQVWGGGSRL